MQAQTDPVWTRRDVLRAVAGTAAGAAAGGWLAGCSQHKGQMMSGKSAEFTIGVQSYCFRNFGLDDTIRMTTELGLKNIEFCPIQVKHDWPADKIAEAKTKLDVAGLHQYAYGVVRFTKDEAANRVVFDYCRTMGTKVITADPDPDSFDVLDKLVAEYDMIVAIHNHGPGHRWALGSTILDAVKSHDKRIGQCLDTGHAMRSNDDPPKVVALMGPRLLAVHVKDINAKDEDVVFGTGRLDLGALIRALHTHKFAGPMTMENEASPEKPVPELIAGLANIRREIAAL